MTHIYVETWNIDERTADRRFEICGRFRRYARPSFADVLVRFVSGVPARIYFDSVLFLLTPWLPLRRFRRIPDKSAFSGFADASFRCGRVAKRYEITNQGNQDHR